jgi:hypothetical protein
MAVIVNVAVDPLAKLPTAQTPVALVKLPEEGTEDTNA